jgi:hypothetical protein
VLGVFLTKAKRKFAPHIKRLFPIWYISFFEIGVEVRQRSAENFAQAFPSNQKKSNVFKITYENFLNFVQEQILHNENSMTEDITDLEKTQKEAIFDRILSSTLEAVSHCVGYTQNWPDEEKTTFYATLIETLELDSESISPIWKYIGSKYRSRVRAAALMAFDSLSSALIAHSPEN